MEEKCKKCEKLREQLVRALSTMDKKDLFKIKKELEQFQVECNLNKNCRREFR